MSVAKSFVGYDFLSDVYEKNGRQYIKIDFKGKSKEVRWYAEPEEKLPTVTTTTFITIESTPIYDARSIFGFGEKGYITIFKGDQDNAVNANWFRSSVARYAKFCGWYISSDNEVPSILPFGITPIRLYWTDISENDVMFTGLKLTEVIDGLLYDDNPSNWIGVIGDKVFKKMICINTHNFNTKYGSNIMHTLKDEEENIFIWNTTSKRLSVGGEYIVKGTIKEHKIYKNIKQTILTRCTIA